MKKSNEQTVILRKNNYFLKKVEVALQKNSMKISDYKFALDESSIVLITDQHGIIKEVNDNACKISKYTHEELIGQDLSILNSGYHSKEFMLDLWRTIGSGKIWRGDVRNKAKDGTFYWEDTTTVPFLNEKGKPYQYFSIRMDITERKNAESEMKDKEELLREINIDLALKNEMIEKQKKKAEEKNRQITNSINYALRIQTAILPPKKIVKQYLENSFILYKPKDIVAGDFYWMETIRLDNLQISQRTNKGNKHIKKLEQQHINNQLISTSANELILFAACDCTGHGIPGAMVSVVCHNALNRTVKEFGVLQPAAILDKTSEIVIESFSKSEEEIRDGMDISLCTFNFKTRQLQWAGANNPLWVVQNGVLNETRADRQPVGMNEYSKPFTNHIFTLNSGDTIYLFTDGFADQFGGETKQKKLTNKRFKELILSIQHLSLPEQGITLGNFIKDFRKDIEQLDDILVMGVRV